MARTRINWAHQILDLSATNNMFDNNSNTRILVISKHPEKDNKLVQDNLKTDPFTNQIDYKIHKLRDHCTEKGDFIDKPNKSAFISKIKTQLKPTIILIHPKHKDIYKALRRNKLISKKINKTSGEYNFYKIFNNWAEHVLDEHAKVLIHGNNAKTKVMIVSKDHLNDEKLVKDVLRENPKTNNVIYEVTPLSNYCFDGGKFKKRRKTKFVDEVSEKFKPTVILIDPKHEDIINALNDTSTDLIDKEDSKLKTMDYNVYETTNITIEEPVILTFSVASSATDDQVGKKLKEMLKRNKIPNSPQTRVLWIDGSHGSLRKRHGEYLPVGGESGLTDVTSLNSEFYEKACHDVGIESHGSHFHYAEFSDSENDIGDFKGWKTDSFVRRSICKVPKISNKNSNSLLKDPELSQMTFNVLNIAEYYNRPELRGKDKDTVMKRSKEFLEDVTNYNPTVVFIGWCYSANGDVSQALRGSPVFSLMLLEHDIRNIAEDDNAKLNEDQKEIVRKIAAGVIRHLVLVGASGTGKTLIAAEFVKSLAAFLHRECADRKVQIFVCSLGGGSHLIKTLKDKYFQGIVGYNINYETIRTLCKRFEIDKDEGVVLANKKRDYGVDLVHAVCKAIDKAKKAKNDESQTILLLDEAYSKANDGVCDYSKLAALSQYSTINTVVCVNPVTWSGGREMQVTLPENCPDPCSEKGAGHGCVRNVLGVKLTTLYRNTEGIRKFLQFYQDHHVEGILGRKDDKLGDHLPPRLKGQQHAVTWVQCGCAETMEKAAVDIITKFEKADKQANIVILYNDIKDMCGKAAMNVSTAKEQCKNSQLLVVDFGEYFGCETDIAIYLTNKYVQPEPISRPKKKLLIITGPDLASHNQDFLEMAGATDHSYTSGGIVKCSEKPCPWSGSTWTPLLDHPVEI